MPKRKKTTTLEQHIEQDRQQSPSFVDNDELLSHVPKRKKGAPVECENRQPTTSSNSAAAQIGLQRRRDESAKEQTQREYEKKKKAKWRSKPENRKTENERVMARKGNQKPRQQAHEVDQSSIHNVSAINQTQREQWKKRKAKSRSKPENKKKEKERDRTRKRNQKLRQQAHEVNQSSIANVPKRINNPDEDENIPLSASSSAAAQVELEQWRDESGIEQTQRGYNKKQMTKSRTKPENKKKEQEREKARKRNRSKQKDYNSLLQDFMKQIKEAPRHICSCCGGLWYKESTKPINKAELKSKGCDHEFIEKILYVKDVHEHHRLCVTCHRSVVRKCVPKMSLSNGFDFPHIPDELRDLSPLEERLVALRLPFMQIRLLGSERQASLRGNVVNVENNLDICCKVLPRRFDETSTVQVQLMRRMRYKAPYMHEIIRPWKVYRAAKYIMQTELYRAENVILSEDWSNCHPSDVLSFVCEPSSEANVTDHSRSDVQEHRGETLELNMLSEATQSEHESQTESQTGDDTSTIETNQTEHEETDADIVNLGADETLIYSEEDAMNQLRVRIAPAEGNIPLSLYRDANAEVLSFPTIYCGRQRKFMPDIKPSYTDIAKSELRRYDRRCANASKILYSFKRSFNEKVAQAMQMHLRKTKGTKNLTAGSLLDPTFVKKLVKEDDGYTVFKNMRTSTSYWHEKKRKAFAMIRQLGPPCLFITLSAAETKWKELLIMLKNIAERRNDVTEEEVSNLTFLEIAELIRNDSVTCMRNYDHRFRALFNSLLKPKNGIFSPYDLQDFFTRLEFQMRGSPHDHGLYWLTNAPIYRPGDEKSQIQCEKFIDEFITCARDESISQLIAYQLHKHSHTCTKKVGRGEKCRFGYPLPPLDKTTILTPLDEDDRVEKDKAAKNCIKLKEKLNSMGREFKEDMPFQEFLESLDVNYDQYILALRSSIKRTTVFLRRSTNAIFINSYNKKLLEAWGANIDVQFIVDPYACAKYCVSYMLKSEGGVSRLLRMLSEDIKKGNVQAQDKLKKFADILIHGSEISAQEAVSYLLGIPNTHCSKSDVFINTGRPEERISIVKPKEQLEELADNSDDICVKSNLDHYAKRPEELEDVCLAEFASLYDFSTAGHFRRAVLSDDDTGARKDEHQRNELFELIDNSGFVKKRKVPKLIRYRRYGRLQQPAEYYREQLMLFVPWRNENAELLTIDAEAKFNEFHDIIQENSKTYIHSSDIHEYLLEELADEAEEEELGYSYENDTALVDEDMEALEVQETFHTDVDIDIGPLRSKSSEQFLPPKMMNNDDYVRLMRSLNEKQRRFVLDILHLIKTERKPLHRFLSGGAGVGKSFVIFALVQSLMRYCEKFPNMNPDQPCVVVSAPTGKAAFNVRGMTLHCTFKLPPSQYAGKLCDLDESVCNRLRLKLQNVELFIIDEVSMVSVKQLYDIDQRLRQIYSCQQPFGGKSIVVVGHLRQLPPFGGANHYVFCVPKHLPQGIIVGNTLWENFSLYELEEIMRQKGDAKFCKALNNMAEGCMDDEDIQLVKSRQITATVQPPSEAIWLFHTNEQCRAHNIDVHERLKRDGLTGIISEAYDKVQGYGTMEEKERLRTYAKTFDLQKADGLPTDTYLQIGGEYFVSTNINVEDGLFNGSTCTLKHIEFGVTPTGKRVPTCAYVDFKDPFVGAEERTKYFSHSRQSRLPQAWTPIHRVKKTLHKLRNFKNLEVVREQIPLVAANGMTIAKGQGSSYACSVTCTRSYGGRILTREMLYTACSRPTTSNGLYIYGDFQAPAPPRANDPVSLDMARLRCAGYPFELKFLQDYDGGFEKIYFHNVQSLHAHLQDVLADQCCLSANVLAFVEPHLLDSEQIQIPNFTTAHRENCVANRNSEGSLIMVKTDRSSSVTGIDTRKRSNSNSHCLCTLWIQSNVQVVMVYKSPLFPICAFTEILTECLDSLHGEIIFFGDLNVELNTSEPTEIADLLHKKGLQAVTDMRKPSTDGGTTIDWCFSNMTTLSAWYYESYYSYHKPICMVWPK